jgi:hypothetical protein
MCRVNYWRVATMSLREKTAWFAVSGTLLIWGYYFVSFWLDVGTRNLDGGALLTRFSVCMAIYFVVVLGLNIATGAMSAKNLNAGPDEFERQVEGRADRIGFRVLEALIPLALIPGLLLTPAIKAAFPADPASSTALIFANGILLVIVLAELSRELVHIVSFRLAT